MFLTLKLLPDDTMYSTKWWRGIQVFCPNKKQTCACIIYFHNV